MTAQVQTSVEIISLATVICKCSERDYERLFIRDPEVKAREGKMAYVRPEYHDRIMRIIRVIGHEEFHPLVKWDDFIADPGRYLNGMIEGEFEE